MLSDWRGLARTLSDRRLLPAEALMGDDLRIRDASSRNRNALVSRASGASLFVKTGPSVAVEAAVIGRLAEVPSVAPYLPIIELDDPSRALLVMARDERSRDLWAYHLAEGRFPTEVGGAVGRVLGLLHRSTTLDVPRVDPGSANFALELHRPRLEHLGDLSSGTVELVTTLQGDRATCDRLDALRAQWRRACVIHNDAKWSNIVVALGADDDGPAIRLIDWEHAEDGDPAWDIASALAAYLSFWLYSIPATPEETDASGLVRSARFPLSTMRPSLHRCWREYLDAAAVPGSERADLTRRVVALTGVRLMRTAFEESAARQSLSARASVHLQLGINILAEPAAAASRLLALPAGGG